MTRANVERYRAQVREELRQQASPVPEGFVLAVMDKESQGNPKAYRNEPQINDGSIGLMQMLLRTAQGVGYPGAKGEAAILSGLFDPATNIHFGVRHLTGLWRQLGNAADVASAYNGGYRPKQAFGAPNLGQPFDTVLARDQRTGQPIQTRTVQTGEYANQPYVDAVLRLTAEYSGAQQLPPVVIDGGSVGGGAAALLVAFGLWALAELKR